MRTAITARPVVFGSARSNRQVYRGWTGHYDVYRILDMHSARFSDRAAIPSGQGIKLEVAVTIDKPPDELYRFWRQLDNLPRVMRHLVSVTPLSDRKSRWVAQGLTGEIEWEAEILEQRDNELTSWKPVEGSNVDTAGLVHFRHAPGDRGTEVKVALSYNPPAGRAGHVLAWLTGRDPASQARADLQDFKRQMEAGTLPTTEVQSSGRQAMGSGSHAR